MLQLFLTHLQGYKRQAVKAPILIVLEVICELLLPLVMSEIVDTAIPTGDVNYIFKMGLVMLALAGVAMFCGVFASKYAAFASQGFGANLRQCLFNKVQEFSFADIDRFSSASLITRMTNDVNAMTMMLAMGLRMLVRAPVMLVAALCISFTLNAKLALVLVVVIPLMLIAVGGLMFICTRLFETMQKKIDNLNNTLQENLVAIRVVKIFVRADYERKKFKKSNDELMDAALAVGLRIIAILPIMMLAMWGFQTRRWWLFAAAFLCVSLFNFDYSGNGILLMLIFFLCRERPGLGAGLYILFWLPALWSGSPEDPRALLAAGHAVDWTAFALLAAPFIFLPARTGIRVPKWFFYAFYPAHLLTIGVIRLAAGI